MQSGTPTAEAIATLKSRAFTERFMREHNLMPILYAEDWDAEAQAWRDPEEAPTLWKAYTRFDNMRSIEQELESGMVRVSVEWSDPRLAAQWANALVADVNQILRAENRHEKEYLVAVNKPVTDEFLRGMARGVRVHGQMTLPCRTSRIAKFGFRITLTQGLNRQIRLMAAAFDYRVTQLRRVRIDNVRLGDLKVGRWRNLTDPELRGLLPQQESW